MKYFYKVINRCINNKMKTRSQKISVIYEVNIDFDEASKAWRENKKKLDNGNFIYVCGALTKTGNICNKKRINGFDFCKIHKKI